jgi:hypothetical protein
MGDDDDLQCIDCERYLDVDSLIDINDELDWPPCGPICHQCLVARFKRQAAEVAALKAEAERLTPREMTLQEVCDVLNHHGYASSRSWRPRSLVRPIVECGQKCQCLLYGPASHYIAHGLLRDAGPTAEREPARGEESGG